VNKNDFRALFLVNVGRALEKASISLGALLPNEFDIELHGGGVPGNFTSLNDAIDLMYLGDGGFYGIIDVGVKSVVKGKPIVFVRICDHEPTSIDKTWNTPKGNGPFKVIEPMKINIVD
jgi:hypothetical protein